MGRRSQTYFQDPAAFVELIEFAGAAVHQSRDEICGGTQALTWASGQTDQGMQEAAAFFQGNE
jgi:hypothetical protein